MYVLNPLMRRSTVLPLYWFLMHDSNEPDVILMDINMPGLDGLPAMKILRNKPATSWPEVCA